MVFNDIYGFLHSLLVLSIVFKFVHDTGSDYLVFCLQNGILNIGFLHLIKMLLGTFYGTIIFIFVSLQFCNFLGEVRDLNAKLMNLILPTLELQFLLLYFE